jgi:coenzyme PQQ synthesis protein D (PqqD)
MSANADPTNASILAGRATVPEHVVYRAFVKETVVLNLHTGRYYGLNPTGGRMLEELERAPTVGDAGHLLAESFGQPLDEIERDLCDLCRDLLERGLIELAGPEQS